MAARLRLLLAGRQAVFLAHLCDKVLGLFRNGDLLVDHGFNLFWALRFPSVAEKLIAFLIHLRIFHQLGKRLAQVALHYGANDIDGTITEGGELSESYSIESNNEVKMSRNELVALVEDAGFEAVERDTVYNRIERSNVSLV